MSDQREVFFFWEIAAGRAKTALQSQDQATYFFILLGGLLSDWFDVKYGDHVFRREIVFHAAEQIFALVVPNIEDDSSTNQFRRDCVAQLANSQLAHRLLYVSICMQSEMSFLVLEGYESFKTKEPLDLFVARLELSETEIAMLASACRQTAGLCADMPVLQNRNTLWFFKFYERFLRNE